jgi:hypothetical protein
MRIEWDHWDTAHDPPRAMRVAYESEDGGVTVTEPEGEVHHLVYADLALTGPGTLGQPDRVAIAAHLTGNIGACFAGL